MKKPFSALWARFQNNAFWKSVSILASGNIIGQVISFVTIPILSRIYLTDAFGEYAIISSCAAILGVVSTMGLSSAIMVSEDDDEANSIFTVAFILNLFILASLFLIFLLFSPVIRLFETSLEYSLACVFLFILTTCNNFAANMRIYINRMGLNRALFYNPIIGAASTLLITLPLGILGFGTTGFMLGGIASVVLQIVQMVRRANPFKVKMTKLIFLQKIKKSKKYILYQWPSNIMTTFANQLPNQVLSQLFGNASLGSYSMTTKVFNAPLNLISTPISTVYFRTATQYRSEGKSIADFTFSFIKKFMVLGFLPVVLVMCFGEPIFVFVLGDQWGEAGRLSGFLALQFAFLFCNGCIGYCRVASGNQSINFFMSFIQIVFIICSLLFGWFFWGTVQEMIICFSICNTIFQIFDMTLSFWCLKKYMLKFLFFSLAYCVIALIMANVITVLF